MRRLAKDFGYMADFSRPPWHAILQEAGFPITICCDQVGKDGIYLYLFVRTTSWEFEGERTDLHDVLSVLVCTFLRFLPSAVSCRIWDVPHPAEPMPATEIYARYASLEYPGNSMFRMDANGYEKASRILTSIRTFQFFLPRMLEWSNDETKAAALKLYDFEGPIILRWARAVAAALNEGENSCQYNLRRNPCWLYYRKLRPTISAFYSPRLAMGLRMLLADNAAWEVVQGKRGDLFVSSDAKNFVGFATQARISRILRALRDAPKHDGVQFIPLENYCVAVGTRYTLFVKTDCGRDRFERERESLQRRHRREAALLFPPARILWSSSMGDAAFENLIRDLLEREPGIRWVRKMGHTNEPEGGRDLIAEWDTPPVPGQVLQEGSSLVTRRRVIVQCKASKHAVGKAAVRDIRDLLRLHDATGFFLAASSHLTVGLIEHLEKLRYEEGFWSDWWTRAEIEERLKRNEDIAMAFPSIIKAESG